MATYKTLEAAARAHGAANGVTGKQGGWLYRNGIAICQGWRTYGENLVNAHAIHVLDARGWRIDHEKTMAGSVSRGWAAIRHHAASFVVPEPGPVVVTPAAVAVDTRDGMVFSNAEDGQPFASRELAQKFADRRNDGLKVPTYEVYLLVKAEQ